MTTLKTEIWNQEQVVEYHRAIVRDDLDDLERQIRNLRNQLENGSIASVTSLVTRSNEVYQRSVQLSSAQDMLTVLRRIDAKDSE